MSMNFEMRFQFDNEVNIPELLRRLNAKWEIFKPENLEQFKDHQAISEDYNDGTYVSMYYNLIIITNKVFVKVGLAEYRVTSLTRDENQNWHVELIMNEPQGRVTYLAAEDLDPQWINKFAYDDGYYMDILRKKNLLKTMQTPKNN